MALVLTHWVVLCVVCSAVLEASIAYISLLMSWPSATYIKLWVL